MTCPAMAIASSTSARKAKSWKAIWCAATVAGPIRAHIAVASTKHAYSAAVRTKSWAPIEVSERMWARFGRREGAGARRRRAAKAAPMPSWATTVPAAEPSRPHPKP